MIVKPEVILGVKRRSECRLEVHLSLKSPLTVLTDQN